MKRLLSLGVVVISILIVSNPLINSTNLKANGTLSSDDDCYEAWIYDQESESWLPATCCESPDPSVDLECWIHPE